MDNSEMLPGSVEGGGPSAISVMVTTITTPTTLSTREPLNNMDSVRRRSSPIKLVGLGGLERQNYCCGHWFPSSKSYHRHLADKAASDLTHEMKLIEIGMIRCTNCSMWVHMDSMSGHLRKVHGIVKMAKTTKVLSASAGKEVMGISGETLKSGTNFVIKVSGQAGVRNTNGDVSAVANSSGLKLVTTSSGSLYQKVQLQQTVNSGSNKVLLQKTGTSNSIPLVSLGPRIVMKSAVKAVTANNSVPISSGSKIIPLQSSGQMIPAARTMAGVTTVQIAGGTVLASSSGTSQTSSVPTSFVQSKKTNLNGQNFGRLIKKCATLKPKNQPVVNVQSADNNAVEVYSKTKDRGKASISGEVNLKPAQSKKSRKQVLQPSVEPETSLLSVSPSVLKLKKKGRKLSDDTDVFAEDKVNSPKPSVNHKGYRRKLKDNSIENNTPKSSRQNTKGMRGGMKKKRGPGRPRKERVIETPDLSEIDSLFNDVDKEDAENEPFLMTKEEENIPTVELDLFTLPSLNEQVSVLLTEPQNPNFKVYASMDAIFVGDSALGDVTNQIGYVTDANNVVYVNPSHFLFPNVEDLENFVPSPIVTMKGNKIGVSPTKACKVNSSKPVAPTVLRENKFVTSSHPKDASSSDMNVEKVSVDDRESQVPSAKLKGPERGVIASPGSELGQTSLLNVKPLRTTKADLIHSEQKNPDSVALGSTCDSSVHEILCSSESNKLNSVTLGDSGSRDLQTHSAEVREEKKEVPVVPKIAQSKGQDLFFACKNTIEMPVNICEGDGEGDQSQDDFVVSEDLLSSDSSDKLQEKPAFTSETAKLLLSSLETVTSASPESKETRDQFVTECKGWTDEVVSTEKESVPEASELGIDLESKSTERECSELPLEKSEVHLDSEAIERDVSEDKISEHTENLVNVELTEARDSSRKVSTVIPRRRSRTRSADVTVGPVKNSPQHSGLQNLESINKKPQLRTRARQKSDSAVLSESHDKIQDFSIVKELYKNDVELQKRLRHASENAKTVLETVEEKEGVLSPDTNIAQNHIDSPVPEAVTQNGDSQEYYPMTPKDCNTETTSDQVSEENPVLIPKEVENPVVDQSAKPATVEPVRRKVGRPRKKRRGKLLESLDVKVLKNNVETESSVVSVSKEKDEQSTHENVSECRPVRERRPSSKLIESLSIESTKKNKSPRAALDHQSLTSLDSDEFKDKQQEQDTSQQEHISRISCIQTDLLMDDKDNELLDKDYVSPVRGADLSPSREWHGRGAKLKAQVLIQDQQAGVTDSQILPSSLETSPNPKASPGSAGQDAGLRPQHSEEYLPSYSSPPKTQNISKSPISPRSLKSPRSPSQDDREWQARRAKLKAQIMISDQQSGLSDYIVDSAEEDPVAPEITSPPMKKLKLDVSPGATRDIRSFFSVCKSPEPAAGEESASPVHVSPSFQSPPTSRTHKKRINRYSNMKTDIRSFFSVDSPCKRKIKSPPHHSPKTVKISHSVQSKSPKSSPRKQDVQAVQKLHKTYEQLEKEAFDIAAPALPSSYQDFEGFERCSRQSGLRAKSLLRLVSLLDMKRWYHLGKFPLPVDHLCDWNEEVLNSSIFD